MSDQERPSTKSMKVSMYQRNSIDRPLENQERKWTRTDWLDLVRTIVSGLMLVSVAMGVFTYKASINQQNFLIQERFSTEWNSERFRQVQQNFTKFIAQGSQVDSLKGDVVVLYNFYERIGRYSAKGMIKIRDVYDSFGNLPCEYWSRSEDVISRYRKKYDPKAWDYFEDLCKRISKYEVKIEKGEKR